MTLVPASLRRHVLPKKAKPVPCASAISWWLPEPSEQTQYSPAYVARFSRTVASKQAELQRSHFGTLASMIHGPEEQRVAKPKERAL